MLLRKEGMDAWKEGKVFPGNWDLIVWFPFMYVCLTDREWQKGRVQKEWHEGGGLSQLN